MAETLKRPMENDGDWQETDGRLVWKPKLPREPEIRFVDKDERTIDLGSLTVTAAREVAGELLRRQCISREIDNDEILNAEFIE